MSNPHPEDLHTIASPPKPAYSETAWLSNTGSTTHESNQACKTPRVATALAADSPRQHKILYQDYHGRYQLSTLPTSMGTSHNPSESDQSDTALSLSAT